MNNDLISRAEAIDIIRSMTISLGGKEIFHPEAKKSVVGALDEIAAVDAEPVRHGRWIPIGDDDFDSGMYKCSECEDERYFGEEVLTSAEAEKYCHYCPNCGAKMDAEVEG